MTCDPDPTQLRQFLTPLKRQGTPWDQAWAMAQRALRISVRGCGAGSTLDFTREVFRKAYTNELPRGELTADLGTHGEDYSDPAPRRGHLV